MPPPAAAAQQEEDLGSDDSDDVDEEQEEGAEYWFSDEEAGDDGEWLGGWVQQRRLGRRLSGWRLSGEVHRRPPLPLPVPITQQSRVHSLTSSAARVLQMVRETAKVISVMTGMRCGAVRGGAVRGGAVVAALLQRLSPRPCLRTEPSCVRRFICVSRGPPSQLLLVCIEWCPHLLLVPRPLQGIHGWGPDGELSESSEEPGAAPVFPTQTVLAFAALPMRTLPPCLADFPTG